jgi:FkbM family methyltransferase
MIRALSRQRWISLGLRRRFVNSFAPPRSEAFEIPAFGCRYRGRLDSYIDREVYYFGAYEAGVLRLLALLARQRPAPVFVDVGANVGQHSMFAAQHFVSVHAFEPYPPLLEVLNDHIQGNGLRHVDVHPVGLADVDGEAEYAAPADRRSGYGGFDNPDPNLQRLRLPLRRGDTYLVGQVGRVDVIKIDVEGSERRVVEGLSGILERDRPALVMEFWPMAWPAGILSMLPDGYRVWSLKEQSSRWLIFGANELSVTTAASGGDGSTVLALPSDWPLPREIRTPS